jgi:hypothetical protein
MGTPSASKRLVTWWCWPILLAGILVVGTGCDPASSLSFLLMPFCDDNIPPEVPIAVPRKEVTVVLLCSFASPLDAPSEVSNVDHEIAERLAHKLKKQYADNRDKVKIVPNYKVRSYLNKDANKDLMAKRDIGKHFNAEYVINLEINSMSFYETGSRQQLYRGRTEIAVTVFETKQPKGEGPIFEKVYHVEFPGTGPIDASGSSLLMFREMFLDRIAKDLSKYFAAYPHDNRYDFDRVGP